MRRPKVRLRSILLLFQIEFLGIWTLAGKMTIFRFPENVFMLYG